MPITLTTDEFKERYPEIVAAIEPRTLSRHILVYEQPAEFDGDYSIDPTRGDPSTPWCHVFLSDLTIHGSLLNLDGDGGKTLIVQGTTIADNIIAGGSFIYLNKATVRGIVLGHYNDGMIQIKQLNGELTVSSDHHMNIWFKNRKKAISMSDFPNSGFGLSVDGIRPDLDWSDQKDLEARTFFEYFKDRQWLDLWTDSKDPDEIDEAVANLEFSMMWLEWVTHILDKGREEAVEAFQQFIAHFRDAYKDVPHKPDRS